MPEQRLFSGMGTVAVVPILLTLVATGCRRPAGPPAPSGRTVLVTNHSLSAQRIYLSGPGHVGFLGAINPGETLCRELPAEGTYQLVARSIERVIVTPPFTPAAAAAWTLELTVVGRYDGLNLEPTDQTCAAG